MSASNTIPPTPSPSKTGRITFQCTHNSGVNSTRSSIEGPASANLELSKEEVFENNPTQLFTKCFLAVFPSKDAELREVGYCTLQRDEEKCTGANPYLHSYCRDVHVRSGCVCVDERVVIPN